MDAQATESVKRPTAAPGTRQLPAGLRPMRGLTLALIVLVWAMEVLLVDRAMAVTAGRTFISGPHAVLAPPASMLASLVAIGWAAVGVMWMYRARSNAERMEPGGMGRSWAILAWFVPLGYLVIGYFVVREIWRRTHNAVEPPWLLIGWLLWSVPLGVTHSIGLSQGEFLQWPGIAIAFLRPWVRVAFTVLHVASAALFTRFLLEVARAQDAGDERAQPSGHAARLS